jgi:hypothetical protein
METAVTEGLLPALPFFPVDGGRPDATRSRPPRWEAMREVNRVQ